MRHIIITADDYGVNPIIDDAIQKAAQMKRITSVAAMANGPKRQGITCGQRVKMFEENHPHISVGLHFTITSGKSILKSSKGLTKRNGRFRSILSQHPDKASQAELEDELEAQIKVFEDEGIKIKHFSDHQGILTATTRGMSAMIKVVSAYNKRNNVKASLRNPILISAIINDPDHCMDRSKMQNRARKGAKLRNLFRRNTLTRFHTELPRSRHDLEEIHKSRIPTTDYFVETLFGTPKKKTLNCIFDHSPDTPYDIRLPVHGAAVSSEIVVHLAQVPKNFKQNNNFMKHLRTLEKHGGISPTYTKYKRGKELQVLIDHLPDLVEGKDELKPF